MTISSSSDISTFAAFSALSDLRARDEMLYITANGSLGVRRLSRRNPSQQYNSPRGGVRRNFARNFLQLLGRTFEESQANAKGVAAAVSIRDNLQQAKPSEKDKCSVCTEEFASQETRKVVKLECDHHFHSECILPWLQGHNSCPNCRHIMESDDAEWNKANSAKLEKSKTALGKRNEPDTAKAEAPAKKSLRKD